MIKTEPKVKEQLTLNDKINIIETISDYIIGRNENGIVHYMPYMKERAIIIGISLYAIDGVKFEEDDNVYEIYEKDEHINGLVKWFMNDHTKIVAEIEKYVDDVVEFKKNYIIHNNHIMTDKILEILEAQSAFENYRYELAKKENRVLDQEIETNDYQIEVMKHMSPETTAKLNEKLASGEYNQQQIADAVVKSYMDAGLIKNNNKKIVDMKKRTSGSKTKKTTKTANTNTSKINK